MFPSMPYVPASMASQELSSTTSTTTTTTVTTNTTTTITSGFNVYLRPPTAPWINNTGLISVASMPSTMTVNSIVTPVMTYGPLDSMADQWNYHQLQEQQKQYFYQANQFNLWNRALIESGNEIALLHNEMERVKMDQSRLEQELDVILLQQKELEHMLTPIEEILKEQNGPLNMMCVNKEYEMIYRLAEIIDAELKRMSQDLRDIIVYLNSLAHPADATEPLEQIYKILNAHMESLQWISHNSGMMQKKVEEVANAVEEYRRKEQDAMKAAFE
ncbi:nucleoporin-62 C-terminal-like protein [Grammomys surdaster]|uniref:nucleoporin-62 C-terminal-like protein n=1 Tax=Grammomys surdaster TaxID=491861 RepID=UPI0010A00982|nr:nucleoporin-62 C-terminal-like protein [Grammomys surdaster]